MINLLRSGLLLFILTLLAALLFWLNQTGRSPLSMQEDTSGRAADYIVENFSAIRTEGDGTGRYMLFGKKMVHYPDDDSSDLEQPRFIATEPGKPPVQLKADHARMLADGEDIYLSGNVVVVRNAGRARGETTMTTSLLHLIPRDDIAMTDKPVVISETNAVIRAIGMEMSNRTGVTQLLSRVRVTHDKAR
jgi:lipopolysaccharide export system protein LptC